MGLFSIFSKNKQESTAQDSGRFSRDDDNLAERARAKRAAYAGEAAAASRRSRSGGDPMLPEKKRARRRLVGAIALALAAAVGLPMLLDSEPRPLVGDIAIQIPAKDKAPALPMPSDPVPAAESVDQGEEIVEAPPVTPPGARAQEAPAVMPPPVKTVEVAKAEPKEPMRTEPVHKLESKPEPKPEPKKPEPRVAEHKPEPKKPEPKVAEKPVEKPAPKKVEDKPLPPRAKDEDAARALALLEGKAAAKPVEKPEANQRFVVQVAALASQEKVSELQNRLRAAGVSAHTRKSGELIRVQVGPFGSREEAEKARAKLGAQGFSGFLVPM
ncbi:SPOR domain-containing protein [Telluria sp. B2]